MQQTQTDFSAKEAAEVFSETVPEIVPLETSVSDASLGGLYNWLREVFSSQDQDAQAAAGQVETLTGTATVLRNDEESPLRLGDDIFADDTIATGANSALTIIFIDGMEFRLGEEAKLLVDDFVFDQADSAGLQSLSALKGAFSYQSGSIAENDPSAVTIKTPLGTLGIRGTKLMGLADTPEGQCVITLLEGKIEVAGDKGGKVLLAEKFDTAKMQIDWNYVDMDQYSRTETETTFKDLLFGGDEEAMESFIGEDKSSFREEDNNNSDTLPYTIYGETGAGAEGLLTHTDG